MTKFKQSSKILSAGLWRSSIWTVGVERAALKMSLCKQLSKTDLHIHYRLFINDLQEEYSSFLNFILTKKWYNRVCQNNL